MIYPLQKILFRIKDLLQDKTYRKIIMLRLWLWVTQKLIPKIKFIGINDADLDLIYDIEDRAITLYALANGNFHRQEFDDVVDCVRKYGYLQEDTKTLIEVGANTGTTSVSAGQNKYFKKVISFEPVPKNIRLLNLNLIANRVSDKVTIEKYAISDKIGIQTMILSPINMGDNRLEIERNGFKENNLLEEEWWKRLEVPVTTVDRYLSDKNVSANEIGLIWIDAQGLEGHILKGSMELLSLNKIPIYAELWPYGLRKSGGLDILMSLVRNKFKRVIDMTTKKEYASDDIHLIIEKYSSDINHTDVLFLPEH